MNPARQRSVIPSLIVLCAASAALAQDRDWSKVEEKTEHLAAEVSIIIGAGGNIGVSAGDDGVVIIDDQYPQISDKVRAAVAAISSKPIRFVINTHWHGDHTGGNEALGRAGVVIVAQDNVRKRMSVEQINELWKRTTPPSPAVALPIVTFGDSVTFHVNGDEAHVVHLPAAHTDGDAYVFFEQANVLHTGDLLFNGGYPVIDVASGGSLSGLIAAEDRLLQVVRPDTKIIPGHGPLATPADLKAERDMLALVRERVAPMVKAGKTADQVVAAKPTADLDAKWGKAFVNPELFLRTVHASLLREAASPR
jgi:glyoxylase-like metal-dependent hydrolase (beta-lactamase superfamily II)